MGGTIEAPERRERGVGYAEIQVFFAVLLAICGGVTVIGGAAALVTRFWKWAHKDTDKNTEDIEALKAEYQQAITELKEAYEDAKREYMAWFASDKRRIEGLENDFDEIIDQNVLLMQAVVAIMDHQIDGNNTENLTATKNVVDKYLIENMKNSKRRRRREDSNG